MGYAIVIGKDNEAKHQRIHVFLDLPPTHCISCLLFTISPIEVTVSNVYKIDLNIEMGQTYFNSYVIKER